MVVLKRNKRHHPMRNKLIILLNVVILLLSLTTAVYAGTDAGPFRAGNVRMTLLLGSGTAYENNHEHNYTILGIGAGYYVTDGLEMGLDVDDWLGSGPRIYRVSPEIRYVFYRIETIKPYAGVFYRHNFNEGYDDNDIVGFRVGGIIPSGTRAYFGAGVAYDRYLNCDSSHYSSCSDTYPEIMFALTF